MMGSIAVSPSMRLAPHLVEAAVDGLHVLVPDPVDPPGAVRAVRDQPGLLEHPQMLGTAGRLTGNSAAISPTALGLRARLSKMARRVESPSAAIPADP